MRGKPGDRYRKKAYRNANLAGGFGVVKYPKSRFANRVQRRMRKGDRIVNISSRKWGSGYTLFPAEMMCKLKVNFSTTYLSIAAGVMSCDQVLGSHFGDGTIGGNGCGPRVGWTGAYGLNYPTGLRTLLQTPAAAGVTGAYANYRIPSYTIKYRVLPQLDPGVGQHTAFYEVFDLPVTNVNNGMGQGMSRSQLAELSLVRNHMVTPGYFGSTTTTNLSGTGAPLAPVSGKWHVRKVHCADVLGVPRQTYHVNSQFAAAYNAFPTQYVIHDIIVANDGSGTSSFLVEVEVMYDCIFFNRNQLLTAANI